MLSKKHGTTITDIHIAIIQDQEELGGASVKMVGLTAAIEEETDAMVELQVASACETLGDLVDAVEEEL